MFSDANTVTQSLFERGIYTDQQYRVRILIICKNGMQPTVEYPLNQILTWEQDIFPFLYNRFRKYKKEKVDHSQWDEVGDILYKSANQCSQLSEFNERLMKAMDVYLYKP
jgi:hypothetical protein